MDSKIRNSQKQCKPYEDKLLFTCLQYFTIPLIYLLIFVTVSQLNNPFFGIWVLYTFIPILDEIFHLDWRNPTPEEEKKLQNQLKFKFPLYISVFCDWFYMIWLLGFLPSADMNLFQVSNIKIQYFKLIGTLFISGNLAASNINIAHELFHKDDLIDKFLGTFTLTRTLNIHFAIEHIFGHHRNVATPIDPATSKKNQTFYQFLPQTLIGSFKSAWNSELKRISTVHNVKTPYTIYNQMIWYTVIEVVFLIVIYLYFGFLSLIYFFVSSSIGVVYLEGVNYIEHYGLLRKEISKGVYEPVNILHSWNAPHRLSNYLLFKLQRHSDHHENPYKPYQILSSFDQSPQLPHGYTVCILLAFYPKKWFSIMNKVLDQWQGNGKYDEKEINSELLQFIFAIGIMTTTVLTLSLLF